MHNINIDMNTFFELKKKCAEAGTNLTEVCKIAGVDRSMLSRWRQREPKTLEILRKLELAIDKIRNENIHRREDNGATD